MTDINNEAKMQLSQAFLLLTAMHAELGQHAQDFIDALQDAYDIPSGEVTNHFLMWLEQYKEMETQMTGLCKMMVDAGLMVSAKELANENSG
jgi:hypothetical protein